MYVCMYVCMYAFIAIFREGEGEGIRRGVGGEGEKGRQAEIKPTRIKRGKILIF